MKPRKAETGRDRRRQAETCGDRQRQAEKGGGRRRQAETCGDRQRQAKKGGGRWRQAETACAIESPVRVFQSKYENTAVRFSGRVEGLPGGAARVRRARAI